MRRSSRFMVATLILTITAGLSYGQTWTPLTHPAPFFAGTALLLRDGSVMVQAEDAQMFGTSNWWRLTPDRTGSYVNGTWAQQASLPSGYAPLYYASAVLNDGRLIVQGGEYNAHSQVETNLGAIYTPSSNTWVSVTGPSGSLWSEIGDGSGIILANGTFMLGSCCNDQQALLNPSTLTWTIIGTGKADGNSEESWVLLPDATVLTVDTSNGTHAEKLAGKSWISAGSTIVPLADPGTLEIGPNIVRPDGTVYAMGGTKHTAIYTPPANPKDPGTWVQGPDFPSSAQGQLDMADAPAALLPNGNILMDTSPGIFLKPTYFFEFDGTSINPVPAPPNAPNDTSYFGRMLVLPTGQILFCDGSKDVEVYTPAGTFQSEWAPTILNVPSKVTRGQTYTLTGTQLNGLSAGAAYGDDASMATNYPLIRVTNVASGDVMFFPTHDPSTSRIATGSKRVGTHFDVPANAETGASTIEVVTNGIPSDPVSITVQ